MISKERMLRALARDKPDRLPVTVDLSSGAHLDTVAQFFFCNRYPHW
jgi:hypothetical protein